MTEDPAAPDVVALDYRWPAEWEPHEATWLSWPHNPETWPEGLARVEAAFLAMIEALCDRERVHVNVADEAMEERVGALVARLGATAERAVALHRIATDDAWVRDHGPIFVVGGDPGRPRRALVDFRFDAWGGKYPPWDRDAAVPARIAQELGWPRFEVPFVLEAGAIDGNGRGDVLTTESCLLHGNRGAGRTREGMEQLLARTLGARNVLWLGDGIVGDDTDGHVDDLARFVSPTTVVAAIERDPADANHAALCENERRLRSLRCADGTALDVVPLPMPAPVVHAGHRCPASYANFYLANGVVLVPVFDDPADEKACAVLRECCPGREVAPIPSRDLVRGLGAVHCLTQQLPAADLGGFPPA